jgi:hypothetical protein
MAMMKSLRLLLIGVVGIPGLLLLQSPIKSLAASSIKAKDPGVRLGASDAGSPLSDLTLSQLAFFEAGKEAFDSEEGVAQGLGLLTSLTLAFFTFTELFPSTILICPMCLTA